jgi:hypothetical protein
MTEQGGLFSFKTKQEIDDALTLESARLLSVLAGRSMEACADPQATAGT